MVIVSVLFSEFIFINLIPTESESIDTDMINDDDDILLTESDIPGASLDGKDPAQLNVLQLKRWLACHGAPVN